MAKTPPITAARLASLVAGPAPIEIFVPNGMKLAGDGVTDDSLALKAAHDYAFAQGVRTVYCAKQYYAPTLLNCGNVIFTGPGALIGAYRKRVIPVGTPGPQVMERGVRANKLAKFSAAANPVCVIVGDSITTKADQITGATYISRQLYQKLVRENPGKTTQWFERGIPTTGWSHFASSQSILAQGFASSVLSPWYSDTTKSWISYILALAPDLIIFHFGANTGVPATEIAGFYSALSQIAAFAKVPDVILITPMVPTQMDASFGLQVQQEARDQQAAIQRGYALRTGMALIDSNRYFNMARDGRDLLRQQFQQVQQNISAPLTYAPTVQTYDLSLTGQFTGTVAANLRAGTPALFTIGSFTDNALEIWRDQTSGNFKLNVRVTGSNLAISGLDTGVTCPTSGTLYWELIVYGNWVQFGYSTTAVVQGAYTPVWAGYVERAGGLWSPRVFQTGAGGQQIYINSLSISTPTSVMPTITDQDMYGIVPDASGGSITPGGGNGKNHPDAMAAELIYKPLLAMESLAA